MFDMDLLLRFVLALALVLVLIVATGWVGRRYMGSVRLPKLGGKRRRLAVVETLAVDNRTRLFLVRRDAQEHLVMLGAAGAVVVESNIPAAPDFAQAAEAAAGVPAQEAAP
jgi:flagellar biogenesis protein FliO